MVSKRKSRSTKRSERTLGISLIAVLGLAIGSIVIFEGTALFFVGDSILGPYSYLKEALGIFFLIFGIFLVTLHWFLWKMNKIAFIIRMAGGSMALIIGLATLTLLGIAIAVFHGLMLYYLFTKKDLFLKK